MAIELNIVVVQARGMHGDDDRRNHKAVVNDNSSKVLRTSTGVCIPHTILRIQQGYFLLHHTIAQECLSHVNNDAETLCFFRVTF